MQAIETEYKGPTNTRGARIIARAQAGLMNVPWNYALSVEENHDAAMRAFVVKWGWHGSWVRGASASDKGNVYVCLNREVEGRTFKTPHPQACNWLDLLIVRES